MRKLSAVLPLWILLASQACAEAPQAARIIRAGTTVAADDIAPADVTSTEALALIGLQARVTVYPGRPMLPADFGPEQVIARNQPVTLVFHRGPLNIHAEGRALGQGGVGDSLRVLNIASRTTVTGSVQPDGTVAVLPSP